MIEFDPAPIVLPFWARPEAWPLDPPDSVFLARAIDSLGPLISREWKSGDLGVQDEQPIKFVSADGKALAILGAERSLLHRYGHPWGWLAHITRAPVPTPPPRSIAGPGWGASRRSPSPEAPERTGPSDAEIRLEAERIVEAVHAKAAGAVARQDMVAKRLVREAASGALECSYRPVTGGARRPMPAHWWETDHWLQRFRECVVDPELPFKGLGSKSARAWIFVTEASLAALVDRLRAENPAPEWVRKSGEVNKTWLARVAVMEEARKRCADLSKAALVSALADMDREGGGTGNADSLRKTLKDHGLWPE